MSRYNPADAAFVQALCTELPDEALSTEIDARYLSEPRGKWHGRAGVVARPSSVAETATILQMANRHRVPVIPYSGGTGLVGGQVAPDLPDPIILSSERMNRIRAIHTAENVAIAEAGVILQDLRAAVAAQDRLFPLMLASEGSARIGGNLATNAGGMNVLRYGTTRELCLGVEAVLADGTIFHGLRRVRKDNTGYDIGSLLVGSEGTLGIITAASLRLFAPPERHLTMLLEVPGSGAALGLLDYLAGEVGELISTFELISRTGFDFLAETHPDWRLPLAPAGDWMVLIDIGLPAAFGKDGLGDEILTGMVSRGLAGDGVIASSAAQRDHLIATRELIPAANRRIGAISSHDISVPLSEVENFIAAAQSAIAEIAPLRINCFGHLGDGNLHFNVFPPKGKLRDDFAGIAEKVSAMVHEAAVRMGGSFSAEHGIGRLKPAELMRLGDPGKLAVMRAIKAALDPNGILNPGVILPGED